MSSSLAIRNHVSLRPYTTLRTGGPAEKFAVVRDVDELSTAATLAQTANLATTVLGWGSNVLPSDEGVPGLVILNRARRLQVSSNGEVVADTGCGFQELFLKTAQQGLSGLEFAVGIPGTLGGALVSNAGAYRSCVSEYLQGIEIVTDGQRQWVDPSWMEFDYRNSKLRRPQAPPTVMLRVSMKFPQGDRRAIYEAARDYQRQRIGKQPPPASAGSFFKNVNDHKLAASIESLTPGMRANGVVPAGFLIEACGLKGFRMDGAMLGARHANFILNVGGATATGIRRLAELTKRKVMDRFGVQLEEEVLYLGDWSAFAP
ncbi:MAG TPA: UDP-N-acetylmuramate dehydrogenase [Fimbriimonas sp.]